MGLLMQIITNQQQFAIEKAVSNSFDRPSSIVKGVFGCHLYGVKVEILRYRQYLMIMKQSFLSFNFSNMFLIIGFASAWRFKYAQNHIKATLL